MGQHPLSDVRLVRAYLSQDKAWVASDGESMRIKDMGLDHLVNTITWLMDRAARVCIVVELASPQRDILDGHFEVSLARSADPAYARQWIAEQPIMVALVKRCLKLSAAEPKLRRLRTAVIPPWEEPT